jgi:hypothetical protein
MTDEAYGITVFCDDIRHEINGKMTLVGCYASELNFSGPPPGVLPTFAALVHLRFPRSITFEALQLTVVKVESGDSTEIFSADSKIAPDAFTDKSDLGEEKADEKVLSVVVPIQWTPLVFSGPALLRVRAKLDSGAEVRAGSLVINFPAEDSSEELASS